MADLIKAVVQAKVSGPPQFQDGICDCCTDTGICLQTTFCTLCTLTNIQYKRDTQLTGFDCCTCCGIMVFLYATGSDAALAMGFAFRRELVQRYGILEESVCKSCCLSICCWPCVICQVQREMGKRGEHAGGCCAPPPTTSMVPNVLQMGIGAISAAAHGGQLVRTWGSGICACTNPITDCCEGFWCPCFVLGYMNNKLDTGRMLAKPPGFANTVDIATCCGSLWYPYVYVYANRREIIERYNIIGESHTMTCLNTYCCTFCAICQQRREMGYSNEWPGGLCLAAAPPRVG